MGPLLRPGGLRRVLARSSELRTFSVHPDALGPSHLPNVPPYEPLIEATNVFKTGQWPGPGGMEDEYINQFMACESGNTADEAFHSDLVWPGGVELLDRIGPCILHTHAFGGFFGWGVADRRPNLVKGIMCMEINGNPFERQLRWGLTAGPVTYRAAGHRSKGIRAGRSHAAT